MFLLVIWNNQKFESNRQDSRSDFYSRRELWFVSSVHFKFQMLLLLSKAGKSNKNHHHFRASNLSFSTEETLFCQHHSAIACLYKQKKNIVFVFFREHFFREQKVEIFVNILETSMMDLWKNLTIITFGCLSRRREKVPWFPRIHRQKKIGPKLDGK